MTIVATFPPIVIVVGIAAILDWSLGEPPDRIHPIAWLGTAIGWFDRQWPAPHVVGGVIAIGLPVLCSGLCWEGLRIIGHYSGRGQLLVSGVLLWTMLSLKRLRTVAQQVITTSDTDIEHARERVPALVGRAPGDLSPGQLRSAAVESAAENLADGFVGPLMAFTMTAPVSIALGVAAAGWVKTINTMDSMLGYPTVALGTAAARLDDLTMWVPARVTALLITISAGSPDPLRAARRWARAPSSPNAGWPMATVAGAIRVRLEKPGAYVLNPTASLPTVDDARQGVQLVSRAGLLAYGLALFIGVITWT